MLATSKYLNQPARPRLVWVAGQCRTAIDRAKAASLSIDSGNVVDLCADNVPASLSEIDAALRELGATYWEM